jgi:selenide,water dikinase
MIMQNVKLTQHSKASGCGCKIAPAVLQEILKSDFKFDCNELLVGYDKSDDAAVYDLGNGDCVISTTDFFMPIVDEAFDFGRVAATNAISDVYAMGGKPIMAISILGWPTEKLGAALAQSVLNGAREICKQAGIPIAGGHSIETTEPIFGLAVTGIVKKEHLKKNNTVTENDILYLTKAIGSGVYSTAMKRGVLKEEDQKDLIHNLTQLNSLGFELGKLKYVTAMTDVTGFGLTGHLLEMLNENDLVAVVEKNKIPVLKNLQNYASRFIFPDNTTRNLNAYSAKIKGMNDLDFISYCDPQTSGGLLFTVKAEEQNNFENWLKQNNYSAKSIGKIVRRNGESGIEFL